MTEHFGLKGQGFKVVENVLGRSLESVTKHSYREAVAEEIRLTKEAQARCEAAADMAATASAAAAAFGAASVKEMKEKARAADMTSPPADQGHAGGGVAA